MFLNGATTFDLTIGLLLCLCPIFSIKGASYCLPINVAFSSLFNAYIRQNVIISFCTEQTTCAYYSLI